MQLNERSQSGSPIVDNSHRGWPPPALRVHRISGCRSGSRHARSPPIRGRARGRPASHPTGPWRELFRRLPRCTACATARSGVPRTGLACRNRRGRCPPSRSCAVVPARPFHGVVDTRTLGRRQAGQQRIREDPARLVVHDVERRADDRGVVAVDTRARHRHVARRQCAQHAVFAIDGMSRFRQRPLRLLAQHVLARRRLQVERRIGLATRKLAHRQGAGKPGQVPLEPRGEPCFVKPVTLGRRPCPRGVPLSVLWWSWLGTTSSAGPGDSRCCFSACWRSRRRSACR